jgi:hypothetical protein
VILVRTDRKGRQWLVLTIAGRFHFTLKLFEAAQLYNELGKVLNQ